MIPVGVESMAVLDESGHGNKIVAEARDVRIVSQQHVHNTVSGAKDRTYKGTFGTATVCPVQVWM